MARNQTIDDQANTVPVAPDDPSAAGPNPPAPNYKGYERIQPYYQQLYGRDATQQDLSGWGAPGIDANYANQIYQKMAASPEAQAYTAKQTAAAPPTATTPTAPTGTAQDWSTGDWDAARVASFFQSKGVTPQAGSPDYWAQKWNEWGRSDPAYFLQRLSAADEIVGGPQNSPFKESAGATASASTPATSPFTDQVRQLLMQRLQGMLQPVDENAPQIAQPLQAAQLSSDRALENERRALAEKLYAQGGGGVDSGALNQMVQQSAERNATSMSSLRAGLIQQEYASRATQLQTLFQQALSSGDAETARAIQVELANLQAQLQREGYGVSLAQFAANQNTGIVNGATS